MNVDRSTMSQYKPPKHTISIVPEAHALYNTFLHVSRKLTRLQVQRPFMRPFNVNAKRTLVACSSDIRFPIANSIGISIPDATICTIWDCMYILCVCDSTKKCEQASSPCRGMSGREIERENRIYISTEKPTLEICMTIWIRLYIWGVCLRRYLEKRYSYQCEREHCSMYVDDVWVCAPTESSYSAMAGDSYKFAFGGASHRIRNSRK